MLRDLWLLLHILLLLKRFAELLLLRLIGRSYAWHSVDLMLFNKVWFVFKHRLGRLTIVLLNDCWLCNVHVEACVVVALVYLHLCWRGLHWTVVELLRDRHAHTLRFVDIIDGTVVCGHGVVRSIG